METFYSVKKYFQNYFTGKDKVKGYIGAQIDKRQTMFMYAVMGVQSEQTVSHHIHLNFITSEHIIKSDIHKDKLQYMGLT